MIPELATFVLILLVFALMYGVAGQCLIDPYRRTTWENFWQIMDYIFVLPYWQMYGDLQLDRMAIRNVSSCEAGQAPSTHYCYPAGLDRFDRYETAILFFLGLFMLFANVLLLNMLIAIFT